MLPLMKKISSHILFTFLVFITGIRIINACPILRHDNVSISINGFKTTTNLIGKTDYIPYYHFSDKETEQNVLEGLDLQVNNRVSTLIGNDLACADFFHLNRNFTISLFVGHTGKSLGARGGISIDDSIGPPITINLLPNDRPRADFMSDQAYIKYFMPKLLSRFSEHLVYQLISNQFKYEEKFCRLIYDNESYANALKDFSNIDFQRTIFKCIDYFEEEHKILFDNIFAKDLKENNPKRMKFFEIIPYFLIPQSFNDKIHGNLRKIKWNKKESGSISGTFNPFINIDTINIYNSLSNDRYFLTSTLIHELGHALDFALPNEVRDSFSSISWQSSFFVMKPKESVDNFVTNYAKKNKWEDFAETFEEYILRKSFLENNYPLKFSFFKKLQTCLEISPEEKDLLKCFDLKEKRKSKRRYRQR